MKALVLFTLCLVGCINTPGAPPAAPGYYRDDVYCWHKNADNEWQVQSLAQDCPLGANYEWRHPSHRGGIQHGVGR